MRCVTSRLPSRLLIGLLHCSLRGVPCLCTLHFTLCIIRRGRHAKHADLKQYATSKLMELMAAEEMSRRLRVRIVSATILVSVCHDL